MISGTVVLGTLWAGTLWAADPPQTRELEELASQGAVQSESSDSSEAEQLLEAELEAIRVKIEAVDAEYNRAARQRDRAAFGELLAKDVVFFADEVKKGRLGMLAIWQPLFDGKYDFRYDGRRLETHIAASGDFGWTAGTAVTRFTRPGLSEQETTESFYLNIWAPDDKGEWRLKVTSSLVVHPVLGSARDPRSGLMTAWPELADQIGANIQLKWTPSATVRSTANDMAYSLGEYEVSFEPSSDEEGSKQSGRGDFVAVWQKDEKGAWQLAAEGFTPPGIYHQNDR